jgi:[ribosomal protein S5]-alanine N-acetyltransferase
MVCNMKQDLIEGSGFILRPWTAEDAVNLVRNANNPKIARNLRDGFPYPYTLSDANSWIERIMTNKKDLVYTIDVNGEACGGIGLHAMQDIYRFNAEVGFWLAEKHWGKGIVSEALNLLVNYGFQYYHWIRIYAGVFSTNEASMRVFEKNGFTKEAIHRKAVKKEGVFLDEIIYSKLKK